MPPRNGGRAAAADGGPASAEAVDPSCTQADSTLDPGANDDDGVDGRAAHLHHLQQQQLQAAQLHHQALLTQAALTSVLATLSTIEMRITAHLDPLEAGLADLRNNVAPATLAPASPPVGLNFVSVRTIKEGSSGPLSCFVRRCGSAERQRRCLSLPSLRCEPHRLCHGLGDRQSRVHQGPFLQPRHATGRRLRRPRARRPETRSLPCLGPRCQEYGI
jgi:hypothetical protein